MDNKDQPETLNNLMGYQVSIEEMRFKLSEQYHSLEVFKKFGEQMVSIASLVMVIGSSLQIFNATVTSNRLIFNVLIVVAMILYLLLIGFSLYLSNPVKVKGPTPANWDELYEGFIAVPDNIAIQRKLISNYLEAIQKNEPILNDRKYLPKSLSVLLVLIVFLFVVLSLFPRFSV